MIKYDKELEMYVDEKEIDLIKFLKPDKFIEGCIRENKKIDGEFAINFLQNELKYLLQSFLNGGFSYKGFILYPCIKGVSKENKNKIKNLFKIIDYLNNKNYDFSESINNFKKYKNINSKNFAILISSLYKDFGAIKKNNQRTIKKTACKEILTSDYKDKSYIKPIFDLKKYAGKKLKKYLLGFYLHGSLSTKDYVRGWSDLDTFAVVNKKTINNPQDLLNLRKYMYKSRIFFYLIDPLQHHINIIVSEYDLDYYPKTYFPPVLFSYSKSFFNFDIVKKIKIRPADIENIYVLFDFVNYFRTLHFNKKYNLDSYKTKFLLHAVTLFPSLYLQAKGKSAYKKYSFAIAKKDFGNKEWSVIKEVEKIRKNWISPKDVFIKNYAKINPVLAYRINAKLRNIKKLNKINTKLIINNMFVLSEKAWNNVKKNIK